VAKADVGSNMERVFFLGPHAQSFDRYNRVRVVRFIERQDDRPSDYSGDSHEGTGGDGGRVEKLLLRRDKTALRCAQIHGWLERGRERELKNFDPSFFFQSLGAENLAAQGHRLSRIRLRRRLQLSVGEAWSC